MEINMIKNNSDFRIKFQDYMKLEALNKPQELMTDIFDYIAGKTRNVESLFKEDLSKEVNFESVLFLRKLSRFIAFDKALSPKYAENVKEFFAYSENVFYLAIDFKLSLSYLKGLETQAWQSLKEAWDNPPMNRSQFYYRNQELIESIKALTRELYDDPVLGPKLLAKYETL